MRGVRTRDVTSYDDKMRVITARSLARSLPAHIFFSPDADELFVRPIDDYPRRVFLRFSWIL